MERPIGLFDSGFGGLTVMKELLELLPSENFIYFADTLNLPYGNKSPEEILRFARDNAGFLLSKQIKLLLIPCHTACVHALTFLQRHLPIPVMGVVQAAVPLVQNFSSVAVLGTSRTIESGFYQEEIRKQFPKTEVKAVACPLFVPMIEEGLVYSEFAEQTVRNSLKHLQEEALLLACTHYALLRPVLQKVFPQAALLDPALSFAKRAKMLLTERNLLNTKKQTTSRVFYVSDNPGKFSKWGENFLGRPIENVERK